MFINELSAETNDVIEKLCREKICTRCRGRALGKLGTGYTNIERGLAVGGYDYGNECIICNGVFNNFNHYMDLVLKKIENLEYNTITIGSRFDNEIYSKEEELWQRTGTRWGESIKLEFNREFGKYFSAITKKNADLQHPDLTIVVDTSFDTVFLTIAPLYIYGRYRKFVRTMPQTKWICRECNGKGCERCNFTGKMYEASVEELIAHELLNATSAKDEKFHGMGREDIDAIMIGNGRPFVIELKEPRIRSLDLGTMEKKINIFANGMISVSDLSFVDGTIVETIKSAAPLKEYVVTFNTDAEYPKVVEAIRSLKGVTISQKTPTRVLARRSDLERKRMVKDIILVDHTDNRYKIMVKAESGTYIKELVNGDDGRTVPSIAGVVGGLCKVESLDVTWIYY